MKKKQITFDNKLSLDKLTIARLDDEQANAIEGGGILSITCNKPAPPPETPTEESCLACSCK